METEEIREKKEPKRLPVWACILFVCTGAFRMYGTVWYNRIRIIVSDSWR